MLPSEKYRLEPQTTCRCRQTAAESRLSWEKFDKREAEPRTQVSGET